MRPFLFAALFVFSNLALAAAPIVTGVDGVSNVTLTGTPTIYGGFAGDATACGFSDKPFSNCCSAVLTCADDPLCACNENRAFDNRTITFTLQTDAAGEAIVTKTDNSILSIVDNDGNDGKTLQTTWGQICGALLGNASCEGALTATTATFRIYLDKDRDGVIDSGEEYVEVAVKILKPTAATYDVYGSPTSEGIGGFTPYPGDEKIYIEDPATDTNFPNLGYSSEAKKVRVFMSAAGSDSANPENSLEPEDLIIDEDGAELDDSTVDGLENGTRYFFRIALKDEAENIVQFFPSKAAADAEGCNTVPIPDGCDWAATPDQVLGLLTEDFNCFVATAAYGTSLGPTLDTFREFRFKVLLQRTWGRYFVSKYYKYGPYAARFIHDKPALRAIARAALWPAYGFSLFALRAGFWPALATSLILLSLLLALPIYGMRRLRARA